MEFRSKELETDGHPASVDLAYVADKHGNISQTSVVFHDNTVTFHHLHSGKKNRKFKLTGEEFSLALQAWTLYREELAALKAAEKARIADITKEAQELAQSVQFDLEDLNVRVSKDNDDDWSWTVHIPALGWTRYNIEAEYLSGVVTEALNKIKAEIEHYERYGVGFTRIYRPETVWQQWLASYRRVFPLEPAEIAEARKLLKESGLPNWKIEPAHLTKSHYTFYGPFGTSGRVLVSNETPVQLLADVKEYLGRKETNKILNAMDAGVFLSQESGEIARQILGTFPGPEKQEEPDEQELDIMIERAQLAEE